MEPNLRLRLVVRRHGLPEVRIVFTVSLEAEPTIAKLVEQVNETIPLESGEWGLEDYVVELRGRDGAAFECLHFQPIGRILEKDDEVFIRPLFTDDLRRRKLSGRHQIASDGRHLIDGVPFGRPRLKAPRLRPPIDISPRKRRRLNHELDVPEEDRAVLLLEDSEPLGNGNLDPTSVHVAADFEDDGSENDEEEGDGDFDPDAAEDGLEDSVEEEYSEPGEYVDTMSSHGSPAGPSEDIDLAEEDGGKEKATVVPMTAAPKEMTEDTHTTSDDESADESDSTESDEPYNEFGRRETLGILEHTERKGEADAGYSNSDFDFDSDSPSGPPSVEASNLPAAFPPCSVDAMKSFDSLDYLDKLTALRTAFPAVAAVHIETHLQHYGINSKKTYRKLQRTHVPSKTFKQVRAFRKSLRPTSQKPSTVLYATAGSHSNARDNPEIGGTHDDDESHDSDDDQSSDSDDDESGDSDDDAQSSKSDDDTPLTNVDGDARDVSSRTAIDSSHSRNSAPRSSNVQNQVVSVIAPEKGSSRTKKRNARKREAKKALRENLTGLATVNGVATDKSEVDHAASASLEARREALLDTLAGATDTSAAETTPERRKRLDVGAGRRLIFGAMGLRAPRSKEDEEKVRNRLMEGIRPHVNHRLIEAEHANLSNDTVSGPSPDHESLAGESGDPEDPDAWRESITYRAVECCEDGVVLGEPPFPFVQRWDPQQALGKTRGGKGKRKERDQAQYYNDESGSRASKRRKLLNANEEYDEQSLQYSTHASDIAGDLHDTFDEAPLGQTHGLAVSFSSVDMHAADVDDLPSLPVQPDSLELVDEGSLERGMVITYKELSVSEATGWQPSFLDLTALVLESPAAGDGVRVLLAKRDRRHKAFDEEGNRVYGRFEAPDDTDEEDDGHRIVQFANMSHVRIVQQPSEAETSRLVQEALAAEHPLPMTPAVAPSDRPLDPGHQLDDALAVLGGFSTGVFDDGTNSPIFDDGEEQNVPEGPVSAPAPSDVDSLVSGRQPDGVFDLGTHSPADKRVGEIAKESIDVAGGTPVESHELGHPDATQHGMATIQDQSSLRPASIEVQIMSRERSSTPASKLNRYDIRRSSPSSAGSLPSISDIFMTASTSRSAPIQTPAKITATSSTARQRTTLRPSDIKYEEDMRQFMEEKTSPKSPRIEVNAPADDEEASASKSTLSRKDMLSLAQEISQPQLTRRKGPVVISLLSSSPIGPASPAVQPTEQSRSKSPPEEQSPMKFREHYADDSIDGDYDDGAAGSSLPTGMGWVQKLGLRRSPRRAGSLPASALRESQRTRASQEPVAASQGSSLRGLKRTAARP